MRSWLMVVIPLALSACSREPLPAYECRLTVSRLDEAQEATSFVQNAQPTPLDAFALQAARSDAAARWIASATITRPDLAAEVKTLSDDLVRHAEAARRADRSRIALGLRIPDGGAGLDPSLFPRESREISPYLADATALNDRCGFFLADPHADYPECKALTDAASRCLAPEENATAIEHVDRCLAGVAEIHSADARVERALRALDARAAPLAKAAARTVTVDAARMIEELRALIAALGAQASARDAIASDVAKIRALCQGGAASTRGPS
ncbi:MAG: hypothetical protein KF819_07950 [Labilithrix sp.]|nr:hypothetical protein [Labilithrix sp.]